MTNPVNKTKAAIPSITSPVVDEQGMMLGEWYRWALAMFTRTGGASGTSTADANELAQSALTIAQAAQTTANIAASNATLASAAASTAQTTALAASGVANAAQTSANAALTRGNNLADLSSQSAARTNLDVATYPISFSVPAPAGSSQYVPCVRRMSLTVTGAMSYCGTPPTANATFTVKVVRASTGAVVTVGTVTLIAHSYNQNTAVASQSVTLSVGDTVQLVIPSTDAAEVGITLKATLA